MAQSDTMASRTNSTPHVNRDPPRLALTHPSSFQTPVWAKDDSSLSSLSHPSSSTPGTRVVGQQTLTRQQQNTRRPLVLHTPPPLPLPKGERPKLRKRSSSLPLLNTISTTSKDTQAEPSGAGSTLTSASTLGLSPTPPTKDDSIAGNPSCSSIIATPMGLGQSKQLPPTPTLTPSQLENGGHAHDAHSKEGGRREGNKLRRAFAARRRENIRGWKSEDVFEVLSSGTGQTYAGSPPSSHTSATAVATTTTAMNVRGRPLEAASSSQVSPKPKATRSLPNPAIELVVVDSNGAETGSSAPHEIHTASPPNSRIHASSHQRKDLPIAPVAGYGHSTPSHRVLGLGLHTTSIPTQATAPKPKKSYLVPPHLSISTSQSAPGAPSAALSLLSSAAIPQTARSTASTKTNRTSVIPLSPGISSAVNYMMMQTPSPIASPIDGDKGTGEIVKGKREEPLQGGTTTTTMGSLPSKTTSGQGGDEDERSSSAHVAGQAHERQPMAATSTAVPIVSTDTTPVASFGSKSSAEVPSTSASPSAPESASPGIKEATTVPTTVSALALNPQSRNQMALNLNGADSSGAKDSTLNHESTEVVATMPTTTTVAAGTSSSMLAPSIQSVAPALSSAALPSTMSVPTSQPAQLTSIPPSSPPQPTAAVPFTSSAYAPSSPPQPQLYSINSNRFSLTNRPRPLSTGTTSTARAGGSGPGSAGASRPVSWAESFQSACTVVPGEEGRRRLSALALTGEKWKEEDEYLDAAEQEEDEEEFFSAPSTAAIGSPPPLGMVVSTATVSQKAKEDMSNQGRGRETQPMKPEDKTQSKLRNRRSMSLDSTGVLKEPLVGLASKRSKELLSSSAIGDANPLPSSTLPPTREDTAKTGNATGKEDKPEVPPKPKRYEPTQQKSKHIRAPSIGSSISQPAGSVSSHSESVSGPSGPSNLALSTKGNITLGSGVYAHAHGKSSSHSNLLGLSSYEREKQEKNGHSHPPSTMHNAGLRSRFVAWTGMGSSSSTDGERRKETSSASSISMSMASGTGSVTSFSSNSNAVGQASLSSSPSSFSGFSALSGVPQAPHSHLGHGQSGHAQTSHAHGQHLAQNQGTPTHPHSHSHRATTPSVSGLGPAAAGLAKRAVEKMGRKWGAKIGFGGLSGGTSLGVDKGGDDGNGSMGSGGEGSSISAEARVKHKRTPNAKSGGWLPGAFVSAVSGGTGGAAAGGHVADGTGSSISSSIASLSPSAGGSTCATSMSGVSLGPGAEAKGHTHTNSTSLSNPGGSSSSGDPFSQTGPNLGRILCGPLKAKGGVVFGRELKNAVRDARCVTWEESEVEETDDDEPDSEVDGEEYEGGGGDVSWSWSEDESGVGDEKKPGEEEGAFLRVKKTKKARSASQTRTRKKRKQGLVKRLENREVPAVVVRCAQHVLIWGVQEEGLFRVPGRSRHVNTLRQEFDTGADWDMTECSPGDLDPHAVASVFKAYLRELPEPILTHKLQPYFDAAINKENSVNEQTQQQQVSVAKAAQPGAGLPSNPKSGHNASALRKPLSLSTLAMPTFSGLPPPSRSLINAIRSLIAQLPTENRDLIRTVVDLIKATARESKETKMPLTNLMLVFCPSLNMSPPLLKVLCEAPGIWPDEMEEGGVIDIRRRSARANEGEDDDVPPPTPAKDRVDRKEIQTIYMDTMSHLSSSSVASSPQQDSPTPMTPPPPSAYNHRQRSKDDESVSSIPFSFAGSRNAVRTPSTPLSSEAESVVTPTSSANPSFASLPRSGKRKNSNASISLLSKKPSSQQLSTPQIVEPSPSPSPSPNDRRRPLISNPIPITGPIHFPTADMSSQPPTPKKREGFVPQPPTKRRSIPLLSLAGFSSVGGSKESSTNASPKSGNNSPNFNSMDADGQAKEPRMKKPSLKLLFSKKSSSSLTLDRNTPDNSAGGSSNKSYGALGLSVPNPPFYSADRYASSERCGSPRTASDSSISTPLSAHTAPQGNSGPGSVLSIPLGISKSNSYSSTNEKELPPVLDTPIEDSSFAMEGMGVLTPSTATTATMSDSAGSAASSATTMAVASPLSGASASTKTATPKADMFPNPPTTAPSLVLPPPRTDSLPPSSNDEPPLSPTAGRRSEEQTARLRSLRGKHHQQPSAATSGMPTLNGSTMSLSLDGLGEICEDWTSSVLMMADEAVGESA